MSSVFLRFKGNSKIVSGPPPGQIGALMADTDATGLYQECEVLVKDASGALVPYDFTLPAPAPTPPPDPTPTPPAGEDAIDLSAAVVASPDCPPVAHLPIISAMSLIKMWEVAPDGQGYAHDFPGCDTWPGILPPGWDQMPEYQPGDAINHTLWLAERIGGVWYVLPIKEGFHDYCTLGPILQLGHIPTNLTYFAGSPMHGYQPRPAEAIGFFCTTGDTRRMNVQPPTGAGRTNVVLVPFMAGDYTW